MLKVALVFIIFVNAGCIRRNVSVEGNWATNKDYNEKYLGVRPRVPIQNIPYIITYIEQNPQYNNSKHKNQASNDARYSYDLYQSEIEGMQKVMNSVTDKVIKISIHDNPNIKYKYDKEIGEYVIDPDSINKQINIPELDERYEVNKELSMNTQIPYKNAYAILQMKSKGQVPNEIYFKKMNVKDPINHKFDVYDKPMVKKTTKRDIYSLAGINISKIANLIYSNE